MASSLGICTRCGFHEAAYVALRVAAWFRRTGGAVTFFSPQPVSSEAACSIVGDVHAPPATLFTKWAKTHDVILWTHIPQVEEINWAKSCGLRTVVFAFWAELSGMDIPALRSADLILCPFRLMTDFLRKCGLSRSVFLGWDTGEPFVQPCSGALTNVRILLPIYDGLARRVERTALTVLARAVAQFPHVSAAVFYSASSVSPAGLRRWRDYGRVFRDRITAFSGINTAHRPLVLQHYDLVLWPTQFESTGMAGLAAVNSGAPVVAFDFPATRECLSRYNAALAPTPFRRDSNGMPIVANPDYVALEDTLHALLRDRDRLEAMRQTVLNGANTRRKLFEDVLTAVFE